MAKKKEKRTIFVKSPKVGETYYFYFAGGWERGVLSKIDEKLSEHYNEKWFTLENYSGSRLMKYPVSIYDIRSNQEDTKK